MAKGVPIRKIIETEKRKRAKMSPEELADYDARTKRSVAAAMHEIKASIPKFPKIVLPEISSAVKQISDYKDTLASIQKLVPKLPAFDLADTQRAIDKFTNEQRLFVKTASIQKYLEDLAGKFRISDFLTDVEGDFEKGQKRLWKTGWMLHQEMPIGHVRQLINNPQETDEELDKALADYYTHYLDDIENELKAEFPTRADAIGQAFTVHRQELYFASIPLTLSLADGIFGEIVGAPQGLYGKDRNKGRNAIEHLENRIEQDEMRISIFLHILDEVGPLNAGWQERSDYIDPFNRHLVMHGHDHTFGTRINSLKAFSLLNFVGVFLTNYKLT